MLPSYMVTDRISANDVRDQTSCPCSKGLNETGSLTPVQDNETGSLPLWTTSVQKTIIGTSGAQFFFFFFGGGRPIILEGPNLGTGPIFRKKGQLYPCAKYQMGLRSTTKMSSSACAVNSAVHTSYMLFSTDLSNYLGPKSLTIAFISMVQPSLSVKTWQHTACGVLIRFPYKPPDFRRFHTKITHIAHFNQKKIGVCIFAPLPRYQVLPPLKR